MTGIVGGPVRVGPVLGMRVVIGIPRPLTRAAMNHALEALVRINQDWLRDNPSAPPLYASGVRYAVEPVGFELWDPYALLLARGAGDCDDLAAARCAELREREGELGARADCYPSSIRNGRRTWHAIVVRANGTVEDPSARLGMPTHAGHMADGTPFARVVAEHEHLEGDSAEDGQRQERNSTMEIRWQVRPITGGGWEGTVWIPAGGSGALAISQRGRSPGDAIERAMTAADNTVGAMESAGFVDFARMIPGLLSTGAQLVRTFTGQPSDPSPQGLPPQLAQLAQTAAMRAPGFAQGFAPQGFAPQFAPQGFAPPAYGPPQGYGAPQGYGPAPQPYGAPGGFYGPKGYGPKG